MLTICQNKPVGITGEYFNGNSFSKNSKPAQRDGAYHLQLISADERLESNLANGSEWKKRITSV